MLNVLGHVLIATAWLLACAVTTLLEAQSEAGFVGLPQAWFLACTYLTALLAARPFATVFAAGMVILLWRGTWYKLHDDRYAPVSARAYHTAIAVLALTSVGIPLLLSGYRTRTRKHSKAAPSNGHKSPPTQSAIPSPV